MTEMHLVLHYDYDENIWCDDEHGLLICSEKLAEYFDGIPGWTELHYGNRGREYLLHVHLTDDYEVGFGDGYEHYLVCYNVWGRMMGLIVGGEYISETFLNDFRAFIKAYFPCSFWLKMWIEEL